MPPGPKRDSPPPPYDTYPRAASVSFHTVSLKDAAGIILRPCFLAIAVCFYVGKSLPGAKA